MSLFQGVLIVGFHCIAYCPSCCMLNPLFFVTSWSYACFTFSAAHRMVVWMSILECVHHVICMYITYSIICIHTYCTYIIGDVCMYQGKFTRHWNISAHELCIVVCLSDVDGCTVCKDAFKVDNKLRKLPCKHLFHESCILPWLKQVGGTVWNGTVYTFT